MSEEYVSVLDRLPCKFGRNDEELNIEIAEEICAEENEEGTKGSAGLWRWVDQL